MTTTTPPCSNFGSKGSTLKLLPGLADCEKIKWSTLPLWMIFRLSRNIFYTSTAFLVHNYLDWDFAFWNQGLHCHFQSEVVFCFCLLDNKCSLLAGSNLIAFCLLIVQPLLDVYRRLAGHWKEKGRTCRGMPMRQTHKNIGKGWGWWGGTSWIYCWFY